MLTRTRERLLLENRLEKHNRLLSGRKLSQYTENYSKQALDAVLLDLETHLVSLQRIFLMKDKQNLPVAFASNALYVLARNNMLVD